MFTFAQINTQIFYHNLKDFVQDIVSQRFVRISQGLIDSNVVSGWAELAAKIEYSKQSVNEIKHGRRDVTIEVVRKMCTAFSLEASIFFNERENEPKMYTQNVYPNVYPNQDVDSLTLDIIGKRLEGYLKDKNIGINQLGRISGTSGAQVSNITSGKEYGLGKLLKILESFPKEDALYILTGQTMSTQNVHPIVHPNEFKESKLTLEEPQTPYNKSLSQGLNEELERLKTLENEYIKNNNIIFVPIPARAGFLEGYGNQEFEESLPRFCIPGLNKGIYYAFSVTGDSMYSTFTNGDVVISRPIEKLEDIRPNQAYIMCSYSDGIILKRLKLDKVTSVLTVLSDNEYNEPYEVSLNDVKAVFQVVRFVSDNTGPRNLQEKKLLEMTTKMLDLEERLRKLGTTH